MLATAIPLCLVLQLISQAHLGQRPQGGCLVFYICFSPDSANDAREALRYLPIKLQLARRKYDNRKP